MLKEFLVSSLKEPRERCIRYLLDHHIPLSNTVPSAREPLLGLSIACVLRPEDCANVTCAYQRESGPMILAEHVLKSSAAWEGLLKNEEYLSVMRPDEEYMMREFVNGLPTDYYLQETIHFASVDPGPNRVIDFLKKRDGVSDGVFSQAMTQGGQKLSDDPAIRKCVRKLIYNIVQKDAQPLLGKAGDDFDAVIDYWVDDFAHLDSIAANLRAAHADVVDPGACRTWLTRDHDIVSR